MQTTEQKKLLDGILAVDAACREHGITIGGCGCCGSPWVCLGDLLYERQLHVAEEGLDFPLSDDDRAELVGRLGGDA